jgi:hypothetical protein
MTRALSVAGLALAAVLASSARPPRLRPMTPAEGATPTQATSTASNRGRRSIATR